MLLAIMSDFHLGYGSDALPQARQALEKARGLSADIVIVAGDLFDVRIPKQETVHEAAELFEEHRSLAGKPVIAIAGTHERRTKGLSNIIEVLDAAGILQNCHNKQAVIEKNGEKVAIIGMAGVPEEYAKNVVQAANFKPLPNSFNVFIFHQTLREVIPFNDLFMCCEDLPRGFDLYVNGHIHWKRELKAHDAPLLLPGSTVITQMKKNETEQKGLWLYDTLAKTYAFHHIASRPFYFRELQFQNATQSQIEETVAKSIAGTIAENNTRMELQNENCILHEQNDLQNLHLLKANDFANAEPNATKAFANASQNAGAFCKCHNKKPLVKIKLRGTLENGISTANIDVAPLTLIGGAEVYIDKEFETLQALREKVELLRRLREEEKTVGEMGLTLLKTKLQTAGFVGNVEELYSALTEGEIEKGIAIVKQHGN